MLKIFTDTPVQDRRCKVFPNFRYFFPCFIQQIKLIFPLFLRYFQVFRNISTIQYHGNPMFLPFPLETDK